MRFKEWVKELFFTDAELVTGTRYVRWKRVCFVGFGIVLLSMVTMAVLGNSTTEPDFRNYQSLSADDVGKKGVMVLSGRDENPNSKSEIYRTAQYSPSTAHDQGQVISRKDQSGGQYTLPAGSRISVSLQGGLNSELAQSPVVAQLNSDFSFRGRTLLPTGTRVLGRVAQGQDSERVGVVFDQFVLPNGHQVSANAIATMTDGSPGIVGDYHSGRSWKIAGALGSSFLAGAASAFQSTKANMFGIQQPEGSTRNAILNGVAQSALDQGKRFSDEAQDLNGYVTMASGTEFQIYLERETDLSGVLQ